MNTIFVSSLRCCDWKKTASFSWHAGHSRLERGSFKEGYVSIAPTARAQLLHWSKETHRWIASDIRSDTSRLFGSRAQDIAKDAMRGGFLDKVAVATGEEQSIIGAVLAGIQHVGAALHVNMQAEGRLHKRCSVHTIRDRTGT